MNLYWWIVFAALSIFAWIEWWDINNKRVVRNNNINIQSSVLWFRALSCTATSFAPQTLTVILKRALFAVISEHKEMLRNALSSGWKISANMFSQHPAPQSYFILSYFKNNQEGGQKAKGSIFLIPDILRNHFELLAIWREEPRSWMRLPTPKLWSLWHKANIVVTPFTL